MAGARDVPQGVIIPGAGVGAFQDGSERRAAGLPLPQSGEELRNIGFLPGGGPGVAARRPAVQEALELRQVHRLPGGNALHGDAHGGAVGLPEDVDAQVLAVAAAHSSSPFSWRRSSQNRG